jgi:hypothetical protein
MVEDYRAVEASICLLMKRHGFDHFGEYATSGEFRAWCDEIVRSG